MIDFNAVPCAVCGEGFNDGESDKGRLVVCPDCGAPYHQNCYNLTGACAFEERHGSGFRWEKPKPAEAAGARIYTQDGSPKKQEELFTELRSLFEKTGFFEEAGKKDANDERFILGVTEKEIAYFQGREDYLRLARYRELANGRKVSLNIFAGLFSPYYLFYSRMRGAGLLIALVTFLLNLPSAFDIFFYMTQIEMPFSVEALTSAASALNMLNLGLTVLIALFYDYVYLRWMTGRIRFIREWYFADCESVDTTQMSEDYYRTLQQAGKPSFRNMILDSLAVTTALSLTLYAIMFAVLT